MSEKEHPRSWLFGMGSEIISFNVPLPSSEEERRKLKCCLAPLAHSAHSPTHSFHSFHSLRWRGKHNAKQRLPTNFRLEVLFEAHLQNPPPVTPLSQESGQPLPPSSYPTMGGGLADHELAVDGIARIEPWTKRDFAMLEDRDTMRGLGINGPHHVSSSVLVKETAPRAQAEASQRSSCHTRFPEGGVDQTSVSAVS